MTSAYAEARPGPGTDGQEALLAVEQRVLWLSAAIVHHANRVRSDPSGLKVGGHQASSASMVTIMTELWFRHLRPADRVSVKPHARSAAWPRWPRRRGSASPRPGRKEPTSPAGPGRPSWSGPRPPVVRSRLLRERAQSPGADLARNQSIRADSAVEKVGALKPAFRNDVPSPAAIRRPDGG